jgi:hypothetical protein
VGPQGPQGAVGPQGPQGIRGVSAFDWLPSGAVLRGVISGGAQATANSQYFRFSESLPGALTHILSNNTVVVKNNSVVDNNCQGECLHSSEIQYSDNCTGTIQAPTAPPGWLCIYPSSRTNVREITGLAVPDGGSAYGFEVRVKSMGSGEVKFQGVWAYTAP